MVMDRGRGSRFDNEFALHGLRERGGAAGEASTTVCICSKIGVPSFDLLVCF